MAAGSRQQVRERAGGRCEYCRLHQKHDRFHSFHVEHIVARQHGGTDDLVNLALACHQCNLHKGTNLTGIDPDTNEVTRLFHPRRDRWDDHFRFNTDSFSIESLTDTGEVTAQLLGFNEIERVLERQSLVQIGHFPIARPRPK